MEEDEEYYFDREDEDQDEIDPIEDNFEPYFTEKTKMKSYPVDPVKSIVNKSTLNARKMTVTPSNNTTSPVSIDDDNQTNNKRKSAASVSCFFRVNDFEETNDISADMQTPLVDYPDEDSEEDEEEDEEDEEDSEEAMTEAKRPRLMS